MKKKKIVVEWHTIPFVYFPLNRRRLLLIRYMKIMKVLHSSMMMAWSQKKKSLDVHGEISEVTKDCDIPFVADNIDGYDPLKECEGTKLASAIKYDYTLMRTRMKSREKMLKVL